MVQVTKIPRHAIQGPVFVTVKIITADDLAILIAMASAAMVNFFTDQH